VLLLASASLYAQQPASTAGKTAYADTAKRAQTDTIAIKPGSSKGLNSEVKYSAEDSIRFDRKNNMVYLYGKGRISYEDFELDADFVRLDQKNNLVFATGVIDPKTHRYRGRPILKQGSEPPATTDSLVFNFKTKKGKTYGVFTEVEGGYLQAAQFKKNEFDEGFFKNGVYSTCNLPHPHFGIHILKGMVTEKQIITGPAYLEIEDIPFPAAIPFGFFPKTNRRASGILFPSFGEDPTRGFYMNDLGYYIGLTDLWDAEVRGSLYSKGSYELSTLARYRKNYKYDGSLNFRFASTRLGVEGTPQYKPQKDFNVQWSHSQRTEANPGTTFSASVNFGTSSYYSTTAAGGTYDVNQLTRNNTSSSIAYGKTFANGLFNFTSALSHSQDFATKNITLRLPEFSLNMSTISPFDKKDRVGEQKWYQRLSVGYSLQGSNSISTKEYLLFKPGSMRNFVNGVQHNIPVSLSLNAFKYFQFNSSVNYSEKWYLQTFRKGYLAGQPTVTDTVSGFSRAYDYSLSTGLSTKVYGIKNFKKGNLMALRHVMTPSVSLNYRPDFSQSKYGFFRQYDSAPVGSSDLSYSIYEGTLYGGPSAGRFGAVGFSLDNNIEAKVRSKSDTSNAPIKIPIIEGLSFNGSYNLAASSFRLSEISFNGRTSFFKQKFGVNFHGSFDPYQLDATGNRIDRYLLRNGGLARLTNFGLSFDFSFNSEAAKSRSQNMQQATANRASMTPAQNEALNRISSDPNAFVDFNVPWNISAAYSFNYSRPGLTSAINNTLNFYGDFSVTEKWKVQYTSGLDFQTKRLSLTQFSIYRDLHCWDLSFRWVPFGQYQSYSVDLRVKASILQDLKLSRRRDYYNNF
jgi:lipopolysaccharide assembly outer membrane protein LptD (OstA)